MGAAGGPEVGGALGMVATPRSRRCWGAGSSARAGEGLTVPVPCRMTQACHRKCVPPHYKDAELSKGESVCLDRCVAKYLEVHERMGKKLTELSLQDEELLKRMQQGTGTA